MIELRQYQISAMDSLHSAIQEKDILLLQAATGAGKTVIIVRMIAKYFADHPGRSFLVLMHKQELVAQFIDSFKKFTDISSHYIGIACAGFNPDINLDRRITIASVQTLIKRVGQYPGADLVIVDETHRVTNDEDTQYGELLATLRQYRPNHKTIGVTATAYRLGHGMIYGDRCKPGRINFFPELTHRITYKELVSGGFLMQLIGRIAAADSIADDLKEVAVNGDYNLGQLGTVMGRQIHIQSAVDGLERYGNEHKHVCVFACTIEHTESLARAFRERGHSVVVIHSKLLPIEREANITAWKSGKVRIAVSVNILIEGFDFPALSCLVFCRPTKSPTIYIQALGRILRKAEGKAESLLIDLTNNTTTFGLDLDKPLFKIPSSCEGGEAPIKICPGELPGGLVCAQSVHASLRYCPHCGFEFPVATVGDGTAGPMKEVKFNQVEPPSTWDVSAVKYRVHTSKSSGNNMIRVIYECRGASMYREFSEYICLPDFYSGYAVTKARAWWNERSVEPFPETCDEFMFLTGDIDEPIKIFVQRKEKFDRILECIFSAGLPDEDDLPAYTPPETFSEEVPF